VKLANHVPKPQTSTSTLPTFQIIEEIVETKRDHDDVIMSTDDLIYYDEEEIYEEEIVE
jgi:hypothetical protein